MKKLLLVGFMIIGTLVGAQAQTTLNTAVDFTVYDVQNNDQHTLNEYLTEGKHVMLFFFFTDCSSCVDAIPDLRAIHYLYGSNNHQVAMLAIENGHSNAEVAQFAQQHSLQFPVISGNDGGGNQVTGDYNILTHPTMILIAPDKEVIYQDLHPISESSIVSALSLKNLYPIFPVSSQELTVTDPQLTLFPNPAHISADVQFYLNGNQRVEIELMNILGSQVRSYVPNNTQSGLNQLTLSVADLPEGHYFLRLIIDGRESTVSKLVITH
ncbi:MAG: redoxin domain-containing protein [Salibacteraceae bacterium]